MFRPQVRWRRRAVRAAVAGVAATGCLFGAGGPSFAAPAPVPAAAPPARPAPPASARALIADPHAFVSDVDFADRLSAVARWSNCPEPSFSDVPCRYVYTATADGWRTSRILPFFDHADPEGGDDRLVLALPGGRALSTMLFVTYQVVDADNSVHRVRISHQPLRLTTSRVLVGGFTDLTTNDVVNLYDPATRTLHALRTGRASSLGSLTTDRPGRIDAVRVFAHRPCRISYTTDGGQTWRDRGTIACTGRAADNSEAQSLALAGHLVVLSPAAPTGVRSGGRGRVWITTGDATHGPLRTSRESWPRASTFSLGHVGRAVVVLGYSRWGAPLGWRVLDPGTRVLGPVHAEPPPRTGLETDLGGTIGWDATPHRVLVYDGHLGRPRPVDPRP